MAADRETRRTLRKGFLKFYRQWPTFGDDSDERAFAEWVALSEDERRNAAGMLAGFLAFEAMNGRPVKFAASTYLRDRRWVSVPEGEAAASGYVIAATYGKGWMAERFARLSAPCARMPPLTAFFRRQIDAGIYDESTVWRERMQAMGWPLVNEMHEQAARYPARGMRVSHDIVLLGSEFEQVRVGGDRWAGWQAEHDARGWPWLPDTGRHEWVYFPRLDDGTPSQALDGFFGKLDLIRQREAAE